MEDHGEPNDSYIPQEIRDNILFRLPAKSICRFRCVSNPWKAVLSDPDFVNRHIKTSTENKDVILHRRRVIFTDAADNGLYTLDLDDFLKDHHRKNDVVDADDNGIDSIDNNVDGEEQVATDDEPAEVRVTFFHSVVSLFNTYKHLLLKMDNVVVDTDDDDDDADYEQVAATELDYLYRGQPSVRVSFFHSCNGLILLELSDMELYLVNPATSESKHLAKPPQRLGREHNYNYRLYGFGFDSYNSEYQLVQGDIYIADDYYNDDDYARQGTTFCVYNSRTDSWKHRSLAYIPISSDLHRNENGVLLNGRYHWLMESYIPTFARVYNNEAFLIAALDARNIKITELLLPPQLSNSGQLVKLGAFRDWLCVTFVSTDLHHATTYNEFWVMKEYGVRESWTKMRVSIPYAELSHSGFWIGSRDLMVFDGRLILYDFDGEDPGSHRRFSVHGIGKVGRVGVYTESLVSIRDLNLGHTINQETSTVYRVPDEALFDVVKPFFR